MDKKFAPSYVVAVVPILMGLQSLLGLDYASAEWTAVVTILYGVFIAIRQLLTGRSTLGGVRPDNFKG